MSIEFILGLSIGMIIIRIGLDTKVENSMLQINNKLDKIIKNFAIDDAIIEGVDAELQNLLTDGKKIKAIKRYREVTGHGLKESKEYIDLLYHKKFD
ncbi:MAG: ribosomal protein L7/L12 [Eubacteriaceae bacterium]